ncbi:MAG: tetratricopeptide repeat protein [Nitrospirota bacterium]
MFAKRLVKTFIPFLIAGAMLAGSSHAASAFRNVSVGQPVPDFTLQDNSGKDYSISSLAGKIVLVIFIRPDQNSSVRALKVLQKIYPEFLSKGVVFMAIVSETDQKNNIPGLIQKEDITFPVLYDDGRKVYGAWGAILYPTTGIVGKDGKLAVQVPMYDWKYKDTVEGNLRLALGEISKKQLDAELNPKANEKVAPGLAKAERHMMLAEDLMKRQMYTDACKELAAAVKSAPDLTEAHVKYGFALISKGDTAKASEQFQKALLQDPKSSEAKTGLGACLVAQGQVDKGIELLTEAAKLNPQPARAHFELGKAYEKKGAFDKAAKYYRKAAEELANW